MPKSILLSKRVGVLLTVDPMWLKIDELAGYFPQVLSPSLKV
ncbi:hypothetical protein COLO4_38105 [Corchorus olitorius]|uniref:Uncharacterized protein n=1 Tax=Corchorus olitorius TaxID=93759 RepID=A0A1R3FWZ7_9ROSI|nr:hypothetical protein COLO4_38105 [Corchorus olitorius]